jgi:hypothetical protein
MPTYLIDTTVLVDVQRQRLEAAQFLKENDVVISYVTSLEMLVGVKNKVDMLKTNKLLTSLVMHGGNTEISEKAMEIIRICRLKLGIGIYDALLAATALELKLVLVTDNIEHFREIKGLVVKKLSEVIE